MSTNSFLPAVADNISHTVGSTPLVRLHKVAEDVELYAKLESFNPGGSAKDRTAIALLEAGIRQGRVTKDSVIVESSSGNLGMALSRECAMRGLKFTCVVDPRTNERTLAIMRAFGTEVVMLDAPDPETGDWLIARRAKVQELIAQDPHAVNLNQYANTAAFDAHYVTMGEIITQLGKEPDYLLVAMSTTGTIGGCITKLNDLGSHTTVIGVDAFGSVLYGGARGTRMLPGYGAGVTPELSKSITPHRVVRISDKEAIASARHLARTEGFLPGASGGAVIAALEQCDFEPGATVVVILHDSGEAYMDTVYNDEWVKENIK
jgi:cysteine synthase A